MFFDVDIFNKFVIGTELKFVFLPKRCYITGKLLWLQYVYKQTAMYVGPDIPLFEYRYYDKNEFIIKRLKDLVT